MWMQTLQGYSKLIKKKGLSKSWTWIRDFFNVGSGSAISALGYKERGAVGRRRGGAASRDREHGVGRLRGPGRPRLYQNQVGYGRYQDSARIVGGVRRRKGVGTYSRKTHAKLIYFLVVT